MKPPSAPNRDQTWALALWCLLPAAALLLCLGHVRLWLSEPMVPENNAILWVLAAQAFAAFAIGDDLVRGGGIWVAITSGVCFLMVAWTASDRGPLYAAGSIAVMMLGLLILRLWLRGPSFLPLAMRALATASIIYWILR